ncbi:IS30 family transposase, partial [Rhizobium leguminosarum]|nr:IS30 family transposase [Rhizobium leguminosarum]
KGAVENTNKRIRRFMPGETDLTAVSQHDLIQLARQLNDQPRKCLGYRTPTEVFLTHLQDGA